GRSRPYRSLEARESPFSFHFGFDVRVRSVNRKHRWERRDPAATSSLVRHLACDQQIDLTAVVFVVSEALVDLCSGDFGEAVGDDGVHVLAVLQETDDVVDTDASTFQHGMTAADLRKPRD